MAAFSDKPDVAIVVYGEDPYAEFQGDVPTLDYQPSGATDLALLKKLKAAGIPVVSIFLSGRPMWTNPELNASDAFVAAWLPGTQGDGVADVVVAGRDGKARRDFTGQLSFNWPKTAEFAGKESALSPRIRSQLSQAGRPLARCPKRRGSTSRRRSMSSAILHWAARSLRGR